MTELTKEERQKRATMLYVGGNKTAYRCHCGCNVFTRWHSNEGPRTLFAREDYFECNGCGDLYWEGDQDEWLLM